MCSLRDTLLFVLGVVCLQYQGTNAFQVSFLSQTHGHSSKIMHGRSLKLLASISDEEWVLDEEVCSAFTIHTCSSTTCTKRKKLMGIDDEYAIFGGLYVRKEEAGAHGVTVEESSCLGSCKNAPCVAIEHSDYYGTVSLEGMTDAEFQDRVVVTEEDMDRIWNCVGNAIHTMSTTEDEEEE